MDNFYDPALWIHTEFLKSCHQNLVQEFEQWSPSQWVENTEYKIDQTGTWYFVPFLSRGRVVDRFLDQCPTVQKIMQTVPVFDNCTFSIMGPGAKIRPHQGHSDQHLRVHLALKTSGAAWIQVGDKTQHWQAGEVMIFQDSATHCTENPDLDYRSILLFDIKRSDYFDLLNTRC